MPLVFERTFGGSHRARAGEPALAEERNPVGVGFRGGRSAHEMEGLALPNLEDPARPLRGPGDCPPPACFGFVAPGWLPRRQFSGTYDEVWQRKRAPYLPLDFDRRFFNAASSELTFDRFLDGGEPIEVLGASLTGALRFQLPRAALRATILISRRRETPPLQLDTVIIEPDENRLSLSYRAALECDKQALDFERVIVEGGWDLPRGAR